MTVLTTSMLKSQEEFVTHLAPITDSDVIQALGNTYNKNELKGSFNVADNPNISINVSFRDNKWVVSGGIVNLKSYKTFSGVRKLLLKVAK